jgi:class 3 adenylate cyclase
MAGDGVNVASRIKSFAVAGSVFISDRVDADIKNQKDIQAVSLGKFELHISISNQKMIQKMILI